MSQDQKVKQGQLDLLVSSLVKPFQEGTRPAGFEEIASVKNKYLSTQNVDFLNPILMPFDADSVIALEFSDSLEVTIAAGDSQKVSAWYLTRASETLAGVVGVFTDTTQQDFSLTGDYNVLRGTVVTRDVVLNWWEIGFTIHVSAQASAGLDTLEFLLIPFDDNMHPINVEPQTRTFLITVEPPTSVDREPDDLRTNNFQLDQNYPNPFNPITNIPYHLIKNSNVELTIYNLLGKRIATLVDVEQAAGTYSVQWNGKDDFGRDVASGVYFYQLRAADFVEVKKLNLLR